jgi:hypothetical protein
MPEDHLFTSLPDPRDPRSVKLRLKTVRLLDSERHINKQYLRFQWHIVGTDNWICTYVMLRPETLWLVLEHAEALKTYLDEYPVGLVLNDDVCEWFKRYEGKEAYGTLTWRNERWELRSLRHRRTGRVNYPTDD